jgi:hypothetical protein
MYPVTIGDRTDLVALPKEPTFLDIHSLNQPNHCLTIPLSWRRQCNAFNYRDAGNFLEENGPGHHPPPAYLSPGEILNFTSPLLPLPPHGLMNT